MAHGVSDPGGNVVALLKFTKEVAAEFENRVVVVKGLGPRLHGSAAGDSDGRARAMGLVAGLVDARAGRLKGGGMDLADCKGLLGHAEWADALIWESVLPSGRRTPSCGSGSTICTWCSGRTCTSGAPKSSSRGSSAPSPRAGHSGLGTGVLPRAAVVPPDVPRRRPRGVRFPWADHLVQRFGQAEPATWSESVLQVAMHSSYHRGQVARRLRELARKPR